MRWESLLLLIMAASLVPVNRWFSRRVQSLALLVFGKGTVSLYLYALLMLPGTLVHELSHFVVAKLLGVRTGKLSLRPHASPDGRWWQLGNIGVAETDVVRGSLIGLAPLLVGSALLVAIVHWGLGVTILKASGGSMDPELGDLPELRSTWPWLYLLLVVGNSMFPSPSDRRTWLPMGIYMAILLSTAALGLDMTGTLPKLLASPFWGRAVALLQDFVRALIPAFACTLLIDLFVGGILCATEGLLGKLLGRSVVRH